MRFWKVLNRVLVFIDDWFQIDIGRTSRRKARVPLEAKDDVPDPNKTLPQWKALSKEALVLRCQALNLVATGGVPKLAKTLYIWYRDMALAAIQNGGPGPSNQSLVQETQVNPNSGPSHCNSRGSIKSESDGTWHMIIDLSAPKGSSINDFISHEEFSVHYSHFDDAIKMVVQAGKGALMLVPRTARRLGIARHTLEWPLLCSPSPSFRLMIQPILFCPPCRCLVISPNL